MVREDRLKGLELTDAEREQSRRLNGSNQTDYVTPGFAGTELIRNSPRWQLPEIMRLAAYLATGWLLGGLAIIDFNQLILHASAGWLTQSLSWLTVVSILLVTLIVGSLLDIIKQRDYRRLLLGSDQI